MSALSRDDDPVYALAAEQARQSERIEELVAALDELASGFGTSLIQRRVPWWPSLAPNERETHWGELLDWMATTLLPRQPSLERVLSGGIKDNAAQGCWFRHPDIVDELTVLFATWRAAYSDPGASVLHAAEWFDRWLPGAKRRIEESLKGCKRQHVVGAHPWRREDEDLRKWAGGIDPEVPSES